MCKEEEDMECVACGNPTLKGVKVCNHCVAKIINSIIGSIIEGMKEEPMIKDVQTFVHGATGTAYATCKSTKYGRCTQWGADEQDAVGKLRTFIENHWHEKWPVIERDKGPNG